MSHPGTIRLARSELADALGTVEGAMTKSVVSVSRDMPTSEALAYLFRSYARRSQRVVGEVGVAPGLFVVDKG